MRAALALAALVAASGCKADIPSGRFACETVADCPSGFRCEGDRCVEGSGGVDGDDGGAGDAGSRDAGTMDGGPLDAGPVDAAPLDAGCEGTPRSVALTADTALYPAACNGANHSGAQEYLNVGLGVMLARFQIPSDAIAALSAGRITGGRLVLHRQILCADAACPAAAGELVARPMRSDWDEGSDGTTTFVEFAGADYCRRVGGETAPEGWGLDGASEVGVDIGAAAGNVGFNETQTMVAIPVDPPTLAGWPVMIGGESYVSIRVEASSGTFVAQSRENTLGTAATLELDVCP